MSQIIYFISDLHLGHKNIMNFGQRNHADLDEMHIALMEAWNNKVRKMSDIVWVLGDVAMDMQSLKWLDMFNGTKRLVLGNHDTFDYGTYYRHFDKVYHFHKGYKGMVLTHIPIHPNELDYRRWKWNIHGHIHDPHKNNLGDRYVNVNADIIGYAPMSLEELRERLPDSV